MSNYNVTSFHPESDEFVKFIVKEGAAGDNTKQYHQLTLDKIYQIKLHNPEAHHVLANIKYATTLAEWLKVNRVNWSSVHRKWNVKRPSPEACELILGLLRAVYNYHVDGEIHGSLWNPDNYLIQYENCGEKVKQVLLVHDWLHDRGNEKATKEDDIEDVSEQIFMGILNESQKNLPTELHHLYDLLKSAVDGSPNTWRSILKHPSLWNFSLRITFVDRVHMYMKNNQLYELVDVRLNSCQDLHYWKSKVPTNTPMGTFLSKNPYKSTPIELFRFTRNFLNHYMEKYVVVFGVVKVEVDYVAKNSGSPYLREEYVEAELCKVCETLLLNLFDLVCEENAFDGFWFF